LEEGLRSIAADEFAFVAHQGLPMILDSFRLDGKNALVTGSDKGLGAGIALALAEAGANVAFHARKTAPDALMEQVRAMGRKTTFIPCDLRDTQACVGVVEQAIAAFGSLDIAVNNAGTIRRGPAADFTLEDWDEVIAVNLTSVFRVAQAAGRHMIERGKRGKIVNIASMLSFQGGITVPAYAAAKGGVAQLTKALANEWASKGINVNAIAPGYMATDNTSALRADPVRNRQIVERIPAARWGEPSDLAGAAVFLCSAASDYVHGHVLVVDGGWLGR
jgi:2-dehydro-3-deoxy-D-gluconate 5-dehydrogenase